MNAQVLYDFTPLARLMAMGVVIALGPLAFIAVGVLGLWSAGVFLGYPAGWAKPMIVAVEIALLPTLTLVLAMLMSGAAARADGARA